MRIPIPDRLVTPVRGSRITDPSAAPHRPSTATRGAVDGRGGLTVRATTTGPAPAPHRDAYRIGRSRDGRYAILAVAGRAPEAPRHPAAPAPVTAAAHAAGLLRERLGTTGFAALDAQELYWQIAEAVAAEATAPDTTTAHLATSLITAVVEEPGTRGVARAWLAWLGAGTAWTLAPRARSWRLAAGAPGPRTSPRTPEGRLPDTPQLTRSAHLTLAPGTALTLLPTPGTGTGRRLYTRHGTALTLWNTTPTKAT